MKKKYRERQREIKKNRCGNNAKRKLKLIVTESKVAWSKVLLDFCLCCETAFVYR